MSLHYIADHGRETMFCRMNTVSWKLRLAGVFVACACGLVAWKVAWATGSSGLTTTILAGPSLLEGFKVKSESEINELEIEAKGFSDVYVVHNKVAPGGHTGWHSHPGPSIVSVVSGTATEYHGDDPLTPIVHHAGTCFVDDGEGAHIVRNEGTTDLVLIAFQVLPVGATRRNDEPAP
jgi:quercetin dioxygenase-like cupin family protein